VYITVTHTGRHHTHSCKDILLPLPQLQLQANRKALQASSVPLQANRMALQAGLITLLQAHCMALQTISSAAAD
jgi:hypothetical protein